MSLRPKTYHEALARKSRYDAKARERARNREPKSRPERKPSGQWAVFMDIWKERAHKCVICDVGIKVPEPRNFSHVLPKGTYTKVKLDPCNIVIECSRCHWKWHNRTRVALERGDHGHGDRWRWKFELFDALKRLQYRQA